MEKIHENVCFAAGFLYEKYERTPLPVISYWIKVYRGFP